MGILKSAILPGAFVLSGMWVKVGEMFFVID